MRTSRKKLWKKLQKKLQKYQRRICRKNYSKNFWRNFRLRKCSKILGTLVTLTNPWKNVRRIPYKKKSRRHPGTKFWKKIASLRYSIFRHVWSMFHPFRWIHNSPRFFSLVSIKAFLMPVRSTAFLRYHHPEHTLLGFQILPRVISSQLDLLVGVCWIVVQCVCSYCRWIQATRSWIHRFEFKGDGQTW